MINAAVDHFGTLDVVINNAEIAFEDGYPSFKDLLVSSKD